MVRGYSLPITARVIIEDESLKPRLPPDVASELHAIAVSKPSLWVPRAQMIHLFEIIDQASPDEETCYRNLVRSGEATADEAISTFLKLLMRILSPKQFAKKFPDIWSHEHTSGRVEPVLTDENHMVINIRDVEGFSHIGPVSVGFVHVVLRAMGLKELKLKDCTWSRAAPGPADVRIEVSWK